jgi:formyltetrahydrofolate deformylase
MGGAAAQVVFHCIKAMKENEPQAEAQLLELVEQTGAVLVVSAHCMQVPARSIHAHMHYRTLLNGNRAGV